MDMKYLKFNSKIKKTKLQFQNTFCYDDEKDDMFKIINQIDKYNINYKLIKILAEDLVMR